MHLAFRAKLSLSKALKMSPMVDVMRPIWLYPIVGSV